MIPKFLYKYRNWDDPKHKRILSHNEIFFTSSRKFNDPFDTIVPLRFDLGTDQQIEAILKEYFKRATPDKSESEIDSLVRIFIKSGVQKSPGFIEDFDKEFQERKFSQYGIFTMSKVYDNILLWSHYAAAHEGFCVKLNTDILRDNFLKKSNEKVMIDIHEVEYSSDYPELNFFEMSKEEIALKHVLVKAIDWCYEEEVRAVLLRSTNIRFELEPEVLIEVIIGVRMSEQSRSEIIGVLKNRIPRVNLLQAKLKKGAFGLDFERIDY